MNIELKICTPNRDFYEWGDTAFANSLAKEFNKLGHNCITHVVSEWEKTSKQTDLVIHISGLLHYKPQLEQTNILWLISHPELHTAEEMNSFDIVCVASEQFFHLIKNQITVPLYFLPQATDSELFFPQEDNNEANIDVLFVGNNYYKNFKYRKIVADLLEAEKIHNKKISFKVVGKDWDKSLEDKYIISNFVSYNQLPLLYSRAKINLNDHHEYMRRYGFINNRTYDLAGLQLFQINDSLQGMGKLGLISYKNAGELGEKIFYYLENEPERNRNAKIVKHLCKNYTFQNCAKQILKMFKSEH